jgi:hypothetical protein
MREQDGSALHLFAMFWFRAEKGSTPWSLFSKFCRLRTNKQSAPYAWVMVFYFFADCAAATVASAVASN